MIKLEKRDNYYSVYWENNVYLGDFILENSGYYAFYHSNFNHGSWAAYALRAIADKLDEVNKPLSQK